MSTNNNDEITIKEIIQTLHEYWGELLRNWWLILIFCGPIAAYFGYIAKISPSIFNAETKFYVEGDGGNGIGGIGGFLGQFGIGGKGKNNPYQLIEVCNSNIQLGEVLLENYDGKSLANKILLVYELPKLWSKEDPRFIDFKFNNTSLDDLNDLERIAILQLFKLVREDYYDNPLRKILYDEDKGYYSIVTTGVDNEITLQLNNISFEKLRYYFEEKTLQSYKETRDIIKAKVDSLDYVIKAKMFEVGRFGDNNRALLSLEKLARRDILQSEIAGLSMAQAEAYKNFEMADYTYRSQKSFFMIIDKPYRPLTSISKSTIMGIIKGLLIGGLFSIFIIIIKKVLRDSF